MNGQFDPRGCTVALSRHDLLRLLESLRSADGLELVREAAERLLQELTEAEATTKIGAEWGEHTDTRTTWRNGHREKTVTTQAGDLELAIPKLRAGSFFPSRRRGYAVVESVPVTVLSWVVEGRVERGGEPLEAVSGLRGPSVARCALACSLM
ncbi:transposase [Streptomyces sp. BK79]|uniref:transposase n=1 Tax=Streptomyces sp. BK79 TaxID=3350097 RepID=UPI00376F783E